MAEQDNGPSLLPGAPSAESRGPIECLGLIFESDEARAAPLPRAAEGEAAGAAPGVTTSRRAMMKTSCGCRIRPGTRPVPIRSWPSSSSTMAGDTTRRSRTTASPLRWT